MEATKLFCHKFLTHFQAYLIMLLIKILDKFLVVKMRSVFKFHQHSSKNSLLIFK